MRPKTTVRPPIIAGVPSRHLSELLRTWRRQPRQRSRLLFGVLLVSALLSDSALLLLGVHRLSSRQPAALAPAERRIHVPHADDATLWQPLRHWAIRVEGRTRLFESYCRDAVVAITGEVCFEQRDPLATVVSWMLDADADSLEWEAYPFVRCEDAELRAVLYRDENNPSRMPRDEQLHGRFIEPEIARSCRAFQEILRDMNAEVKPLSLLQRQAAVLQTRLNRWQRIRAGEVEGVGGVEMRTVSAELCQAYQSGDKELFAAALNDFLDSSRQSSALEDDPAVRRRLAAEQWLNEREPTSKALQLSLLASACLAAAALVRMRRPVWHRVLFRAGVMSALGCLAWSTAALVARAIQDDSFFGDGERGTLFLAAATMAVGLGLALLHREAGVALLTVVASCLGFLLAQGGGCWPTGFAPDAWSSAQQFMLLSAFAAWTVAWSVAVVACCGVLCTAPNGERLRRLERSCLSAIRIGVVLMVASACLDGLRAVVLDDSWRGQGVQALGTLVLLPSGFLLLHMRRHGSIQSFTAAMSIAIALPLVVLIGFAVHRLKTWSNLSAVEAWIHAVGLLSLSVAFHAALRYFYGRQCAFDT